MPGGTRLNNGGLFNLLHRFRLHTQHQNQTHAPTMISMGNSPKDNCLQCLQNMIKVDLDQSKPENKVQLRKTIDTLVKVINNAHEHPMVAKYRKLPKAAKTVQADLLAFPNAVQVLNVAGFVESGDHLEIMQYKQETLKDCMDAIVFFCGTLGANVQKDNTFDPYAESCTSATMQVIKTAGESEHVKDGSGMNKHEVQIAQADAIMRQRRDEYEGTLEDREIIVYNSRNLNRQQEQQMVTAQEEKMMINTKEESSDSDEEAGVQSLARVLQESKKNELFRDKRAEALDNLKRQAHHTRTKIRFKFPDDYVLQASFGAKEKTDAIYEFVRENIVDKTRKFYLFTSPPKKNVTKDPVYLFKANLVPTAIVYFCWEDLPVTKQEHGPFMDIAKLRDFMISH